MNPVHILPLAENDLLEVWLHIASDGQGRADAYLDFLTAKFDLIASTPRIGRAADQLSSGLRRFPVDDYVIFYMESPTGICVVRVLHGAQDIERILSAA